MKIIYTCSWYSNVLIAYINLINAQDYSNIVSMAVRKTGKTFTHLMKDIHK